MERDKSVLYQLSEQEQDSVIKFLKIYTCHLESELKKLSMHCFEKSPLTNKKEGGKNL